MSRLRSNLIGSLVVAAAVSLPTLVEAAQVGFWIDVRYTAELIAPPFHIRTYRFELDSIDKVTTLCSSSTNLMRVVRHIQRTDTFLQHEAIGGADCVKDRSGKIKFASDVSAEEGK